VSAPRVVLVARAELERHRIGPYTPVLKAQRDLYALGLAFSTAVLCEAQEARRRDLAAGAALQARHTSEPPPPRSGQSTTRYP
jgi:hypothetical protein